DIDGATLVWMVHLGEFPKEAAATEMRDKLRRMNFPTFHESYEKDGKKLWRLRVGPEMSVKRAEALKVRVEKASGLTGKLIRHR
ncbi:MAG: SPOR domain-containing protein, partial [Gammaproteobacteria bacterium]|nr:SPOR domain-containing protein [Gammaproteobacteria bacterium]